MAIILDIFGLLKPGVMASMILMICIWFFGVIGLTIYNIYFG